MAANPYAAASGANLMGYPGNKIPGANSMPDLYGGAAPPGGSNLGFGASQGAAAAANPSQGLTMRGGPANFGFGASQGMAAGSVTPNQALTMRGSESAFNLNPSAPGLGAGTIGKPGDANFDPFVGYKSTGTMSVDAKKYFDQNPDVAAAYAKDHMGLNEDQFAAAHYLKYGQNEGRNNPNIKTPLPPWVTQDMAQQAPSGGGASGYQKNPYLDQMAAGITQQMTDNWNRNLAPSIRSGAMAAGGFGGSRQGVVEANGLNDLNRSLGQNLASLYGQDWTNSQNRALQQQQINNQNNQYYAGLDSNNAQFGANLGLSTLNAQNNWANQNLLTANQIAQTPINYFGTFNNNANQIAGQGGTASQTNQGNPYLGALGGAQLGYKLFGG